MEYIVWDRCPKCGAAIMFDPESQEKIITCKCFETKCKCGVDESCECGGSCKFSDLDH